MDSFAQESCPWYEGEWAFGAWSSTEFSNLSRALNGKPYRNLNSEFLSRNTRKASLQLLCKIDRLFNQFVMNRLLKLNICQSLWMWAQKPWHLSDGEKYLVWGTVHERANWRIFRNWVCVSCSHTELEVAIPLASIVSQCTIVPRAWRAWRAVCLEAIVLWRSVISFAICNENNQIQ